MDIPVVEPSSTLANDEASLGLKVMTQTRSRKERILDQFSLLEKEVFQSEATYPGIAFVDRLIQLQDEDAEKNKNSYLHYLDVYTKNKDIFKNKMLDSYLKCRNKMQVDYGVYIPNITQADTIPGQVPFNSHVTSVKLKYTRKKYKTITDQRNSSSILHKSRCIANGAAFINRNPVLKEGLYWKLKRNLCCPLEKGLKKEIKTLSDIFIKLCYIIGEHYIKYQTEGRKKKDNAIKQIISAKNDSLCVKSLVSVYSNSYLHIYGSRNVIGKQTKKGSLTAIQRSIAEVEAVKQKIAGKLKSENISVISSSSESEDQELVLVKSENASVISDADPELKFVDNLIKYKDKEYEELKKDYTQLIEKYDLAGLLEPDLDLDAHLECREKLQIASGVYIPNVYSPDICPSDAIFYESCFKSRNTPVTEILEWSMTSDVEESLYKSKCIANGLSIINEDSVLKRKVYQKLSLANKVSDDKSLKMLSVVLEEELSDIGREHLGLKLTEMWLNKYDILSVIISGIINYTLFKYKPSIYFHHETDTINSNNVFDPVKSSVRTLEQISDSQRVNFRSSGPAAIINSKVVPPRKKKNKGRCKKRGETRSTIKLEPKIARNILWGCFRKLKGKLGMTNISEKTRKKYNKRLTELEILLANKSTYFPCHIVMKPKKRKGKKRTKEET